jgi:hypothetical protein
VNVYELLAALNQLVEQNPSIADLPVLFEGNLPLAAVEYHPGVPPCVMLQMDEPASA